MKIEIDAKELATLINMIGERREPVSNADDLAKEVLGRIGNTVVDQIVNRN